MCVCVCRQMLSYICNKEITTNGNKKEKRNLLESQEPFHPIFFMRIYWKMFKTM